MRTDISDPHLLSNWDDFVKSYDNSCFFHSSAWMRVLLESYGYVPCAIAIGDDDKRAVVVAAEVRSPFGGVRGVSLPFSDVVPVLTRGGPCFDEIGSQLSAFSVERRWHYFELRDGSPIDGWPNSASFVEHTLDLRQGADRLCGAFRSSNWRNIRKARAEGVRVVKATTTEALDVYYRLHCLTHKRHGVPPQPVHFFRHLHDFVLMRGGGFILLAYRSQDVIAGGIFLHFGQKALFKFGASISRYQHLRPNNLLMWEAVSWYSGHGYETLSLGRTDPSDRGLLQFKNGWGGEQHMIRYARWPRIRRRTEVSSCLENGARAVARRLPVSMLQLAGRIAYRHFG